jgi:hypothetical protein
MSVPAKHRAKGASRAATATDARTATPPNELAVPIGPRVVELLEVAYRARRPILLEGPTGIGKSQIVAEFARASGLSHVVLDLSLLEPPDLVGLPVIQDGRTHYASPAELPTSGRGILMLEELNRAEIPVMQPALQLLSARRLHAYELPPGWTCVAAVNPEDGDYQVNRLDPALRSRFLQLSVCADRDQWLEWATHVNVHPVIARVVGDHADAFDWASPRSWAYASDVLHALRRDELENRELVRVALRGYLPTSWATLVTEALARHRGVPAIDPDVVFGDGGAAALQRIVAELESAQRIDAVAMVASKLRALLSRGELVARVESGAVTLASLEALLATLPGDLREQCLETAVESAAAPAFLQQLGVQPSDVTTSYVGSVLAKQVQAWRRELCVWRVRLVVVTAFRHLVRARLDDAALERVAPQVSALVADAGPIADDLARWLRAQLPRANA